MKHNYCRQTMLRLVNKNETIRMLVRDKEKELADTGLFNAENDSGNSLEAWDAAMVAVFKSQIENDPAGVWNHDWTSSNAINNPYLPIPEDSEMMAMYRKLVNVHGWDRVVGELARFCEVLAMENKNAGYDNHTAKWNKLANDLWKIANARVMT